ncbi:hypothetical protein GJ744_004605 [Endocarpon pusillum]|uniref:Uncharacterized protein n=1 Tax=Endocarpon pusillum TaxID=364733 RepID=A0A8H7AQX8_9EURO|nr:hypothetical protein GJ744_004605 [Endocarpon pusillum]
MRFYRYLYGANAPPEIEQAGEATHPVRRSSNVRKKSASRSNGTRNSDASQEITWQK